MTHCIILCRIVCLVIRPLPPSVTLLFCWVSSFWVLSNCEWVLASWA